MVKKGHRSVFELIYIMTQLSDKTPSSTGDIPVSVGRDFEEEIIHHVN